MVRRRESERGFAMVIVVLIVALVAVVAVTLLDVVKVDLSMSGQGRKNVEARSAADAALMEIVDDLRTRQNYVPQDMTNLHTVIADPTNAFGGGAVPCPSSGAPCSTSPYYRPAGSDNANALVYSADVCFLRFGAALDTGFEHTQALTYEARTIGDVNDGEATAEARAQFYSFANVDPGTFTGRRHCR